MSGELEGKVAFITGSGSGIGAAAAELFAAEGAAVVVADLNLDAARATVQTISDSGGRALAVEVDVSRRVSLQAAVDRAADEFGGIDVLMNNAGVPMPVTPLTEVSEELFDRIIGVNLKGVFLGCQVVVPLMRARGGGSIVMTSALSGIKARPGLNVYAASKGGVNMLTKSLARELAPDNIRVNAILPVATDTPMMSNFALEAPGTERGASLAAAVPLGRLGQPIDNAQAALFLASDRSAFVTGTLLPVDGGSAT